MPYKDKEAARAYYLANRERKIAAKTQWVIDNREYNNAARRARYAADPKERAARYAWRDANPEKAAYSKHKQDAKRRGIPFLLTFEEWWNIWDTSGKFAERGHCNGQYVMARFGDQGGYEIGNVRIITCNDNSLEMHAMKRKRRHV